MVPSQHEVAVESRDLQRAFGCSNGLTKLLPPRTFGLAVKQMSDQVRNRAFASLRWPVENIELVRELFDMQVWPGALASEI